jgi:cellulose synthase/poly-beta-1,6-N-acetylglucosamine synthase-like glycosyltransferase
MTLFWLALGLLGYTYLLFPILVLVRGWLWPKPIKSNDITPTLSMIIAAHNEEQSIGAKLDNILSLDYPADRLEVLIASDGSNDQTEPIVRQYAARGIRLLSLPRQGKAAALNAAVARSQGEILVFSDANSMYASDALRRLVRPLADPDVGGVAGDQRYRKGRTRGVSEDGERSYWRFDRMLKRFESRAGNVISATGAIYAIRQSLRVPLPEGVTDDFVTSTRVIAQGNRLVFAPDAIAYEPVAGSSAAEFGRKVRVITRGFRGVILMRQLLNPARYGFYAIQFWSHKVLRRLMVVPLLVLIVASLLLWRHGALYQVALVVQLGFYSCAALGAMGASARASRNKLFTIPFYFCLVNAASLVAAVNVLRGHRIDRWDPQRHGTGAATKCRRVSPRPAES